jgi:hypothetical protein
MLFIPEFKGDCPDVKLGRGEIVLTTMREARSTYKVKK